MLFGLVVDVHKLVKLLEKNKEDILTKNKCGYINEAERKKRKSSYRRTISHDARNTVTLTKMVSMLACMCVWERDGG